MFPDKTLETAIRDEITSAINDRPTPRGAWEPEVDSLIMVRVVLRVEEELGIKLPDDVMPSGGFDGIEHCITVVMKACGELWNVQNLVKEKI
jgi:acyl carrier protein